MKYRLARCALAAGALALLLGGCAGRRAPTDSFLGVITPYRIDIVQGNVVTKEAVEALRPGMARAQVVDILGSPMLADPFHRDRWDYIFTIRSPGTSARRMSVVLRFDGDLLKSVSAPPDLPTEQQFVASIAPTSRSASAARPLELSEAQRKALPAPRPEQAAPAAPVPPTRSYPPLERP